MFCDPELRRLSFRPSATPSPRSWWALESIIWYDTSTASGPHAGRVPRPDRLVVSDGLCAWRWSNGSAGAAGQAILLKHRGEWQPQSRISDHQPASWDARHRCPYGCLSCRHRAAGIGGLSKAGSRASPQGVDQFRPGLGSRARGHGSCHPRDLACRVRFCSLHPRSGSIARLSSPVRGNVRVTTEIFAVHQPLQT